MTLQVQVISKEIIKPSSPTPDHLRYYFYSFLDLNLAPQFYTSMVLFFEFNGERQPNITEISKHLKTSLAEVLSLYYPLAGRANNNLYMDCNDEGVPFLVAHVNNCKLSDVLRNPVPDEFTKLVAFELDDVGNKIPLGVQLNIFECGGFAIGQCISHKIADGLSMLMFSRAWAATARRALGDHQAEVHCPEFTAATLFPTKLLAHVHPINNIDVAKNKVTKRFLFDAYNIEYLRAKYVGAMMKRPSRVETLSAFIWSRFAAISKDDGIHDNQKLHKQHIVFHAVNLRPRFDPPLPQHLFGNLVGRAVSTPSLLNTREECHGLPRQIREAINKIDTGYIKKLQQGHGHDQGSSSEGGEKVISDFTGMCKFPLYDNDFGWGRPSWVYVGVPVLNFVNNLVMFIETRDSNGIEAYISSGEEVLAKLESDSEFLQRACPGPALCVERP